MTSPTRPDPSVDTYSAGDEREEQISHRCVRRGRARGVPRAWILISGRGKDGQGCGTRGRGGPMTGDVSESARGRLSSALGERKGRDRPRRRDPRRTADLFVERSRFSFLLQNSPSSRHRLRDPHDYCFRRRRLQLHLHLYFRHHQIVISRPPDFLCIFSPLPPSMYRYLSFPWRKFQFLFPIK